MSLKKTVSTVYGVTVADAYHRVEAVQLPSKNEMQFVVRSYADQSKPFFSEKLFNCAYDLAGVNPISQAYSHLKTLSDFAGAQDC
jgi:hypothetical protein